MPLSAVRLASELIPAHGSARFDLIGAAVLGATAAALVIPQSLAFGHLIERVFLDSAPLAQVARPLLVLVVLALARSALTWTSDAAGARAAAWSKAAARGSIVSRVLEQGPAWLAREQTGEIVTQLGAGVDALDAYIGQYLPRLALAVIVPLLIGVAVAVLDPLSALVLAITGPLIPLFTYLIAGAARERTRRQWATLSRLGARFLESVQGLPTLKAFGRSAQQADAIAQASERFRIVTLAVLRIAFLSALTLELLATIGTAIVAVEVGLRLLYGRIALANALAILLLAPEFYRPLRALGAAFHPAIAGRDVGERVLALREMAPVVTKVETGIDRSSIRDARPAPDTRANIQSKPDPAHKGRTRRDVPHTDGVSARLARPLNLRVEHVTCRYPGRNAAALDDVTFDVGAGETVAVVGPTGAGKTTLAHALLGFIDCGRGRILVNGQPRETLSTSEWRALVSWAPQHPHLFATTVFDNVRLSKPHASPDEVERALRRAGAQEVVARLPDGLDTHVGEHGARLSGGEAQRVALARVFLEDTPIVVLDEPTAHLDPANEAAISAALRELRRDRTILLIAHRLTTVVDADRVVVLVNGRVQEYGTPRELLDRGRVYPRLVAAFRGDA